MAEWNKKLKENIARYKADRSVENAIYLLEDAKTKTQIRLAIYYITHKTVASDFFPKHYFVGRKNELLNNLKEEW
tara:strand:+ start:315 stop:539 length:225 start_codon:yes stop_codon:yes gene_type:complete